MTITGLPGLRGADHFAFTVPDIDAACEFFENVIGAQVLFSVGPVSDEQGTWMTDNLNVDSRAKIADYRLLRCGNGTNLEIFQYECDGQKQQPPKNSDIGGYHLSFYVDDMDVAVAHLRKHGVRVLGEPKRVISGPTAGLTWIYFLAPWGMQLELVTAENGIAYDKSGRTLLWHPKYPAARPYDTSSPSD